MQKILYGQISFTARIKMCEDENQNPRMRSGIFPIDSERILQFKSLTEAVEAE